MIYGRSLRLVFPFFVAEIRDSVQRALAKRGDVRFAIAPRWPTISAKVKKRARFNFALLKPFIDEIELMPASESMRPNSLQY